MFANWSLSGQTTSYCSQPFWAISYGCPDVSGVLTIWCRTAERIRWCPTRLSRRVCVSRVTRISRSLIHRRDVGEILLSLTTDRYQWTASAKKMNRLMGQTTCDATAQWIKHQSVMASAFKASRHKPVWFLSTGGWSWDFGFFFICIVWCEFFFIKTWTSFPRHLMFKSELKSAIADGIYNIRVRYTRVSQKPPPRDTKCLLP